jgi:hypothetical protein
VADEDPCLSKPHGERPRSINTIYTGIYNGVSAAGDEAVVWWDKRKPAHEASANIYAAALTTAWPKLTGAFKAPVSDAGRQCLNAGDGRFDVYITTGITNRAQVLPMGIWEVGGPTGGRVNWGGCTTRVHGVFPYPRDPGREPRHRRLRPRGRQPAIHRAGSSTTRSASSPRIDAGSLRGSTP